MVAIRSPSWTTSPSATCILVTTPGPSARTGISIFIDSRITRVSPSSTLSPSAATTFHTFATISARTSATGDSSCRCLEPLPGTQLAHQGRIVVPADELRAGEQVRVEGQVRLWPGDAEGGHRLPRAVKGLRPVGAVDAELGQQRVVERRHRVARLIAGVHPHALARGLVPLGDRARAGQEPDRVLGVDPQL